MPLYFKKPYQAEILFRRVTLHRQKISHIKPPPVPKYFRPIEKSCRQGMDIAQTMEHYFIHKTQSVDFVRKFFILQRT